MTAENRSFGNTSTVILGQLKLRDYIIPFKNYRSKVFRARVWTCLQGILASWYFRVHPELLYVPVRFYNWKHYLFRYSAQIPQMLKVRYNFRNRDNLWYDKSANANRKEKYTLQQAQRLTHLLILQHVEIDRFLTQKMSWSLVSKVFCISIPTLLN